MCIPIHSFELFKVCFSFVNLFIETFLPQFISLCLIWLRLDIINGLCFYTTKTTQTKLIYDCKYNWLPVGNFLKHLNRICDWFNISSLLLINLAGDSWDLRMDGNKFRLKKVERNRGLIASNPIQAQGENWTCFLCWDHQSWKTGCSFST